MNVKDYADAINEGWSWDVDHNNRPRATRIVGKRLEKRFGMKASSKRRDLTHNILDYWHETDFKKQDALG